MNNFNKQNNFFWIINKNEFTPSGQIYLGSFLAISILGAIYLGNLFFLLIVLLASLFIFLNKEKDIQDVCVLGKESFLFEDKEYFYEDMSAFFIVEEIWDKKVKILVFKSKNMLNTTIFIPIENNVEISKIRAIIPKSLKEEKTIRLSILDKIMIRFFI